MKEIVVLSGKGGTGKTSLTAAFVHLSSLEDPPCRLVVGDTDVDASNLELVLSSRQRSRGEFEGGKLAVIDQKVCTACGTCQEVCRFDAIPSSQGEFRVDPLACEGCAACVYQCPEGALTLQQQIAGEWYHADAEGIPLFHAHLFPGQENSGKLVHLVKEKAQAYSRERDYQLLLVDGPPGVGCPVISAVSGADLALIVTEPTASGLHDLTRILETTDHFDVRSMVCINKFDIYPEGTDDIEQLCRSQGRAVVGKIPYDPSVTFAMVQGFPVTKAYPGSPASRAIARTWKIVMEWECVSQERC